MAAYHTLFDDGADSSSLEASMASSAENSFTSDTTRTSHGAPYARGVCVHGSRRSEATCSCSFSDSLSRSVCSTCGCTLTSSYESDCSRCNNDTSAAADHDDTLASVHRGPAQPSSTPAAPPPPQGSPSDAMPPPPPIAPPTSAVAAVSFVEATCQTDEVIPPPPPPPPPSATAGVQACTEARPAGVQTVADDTHAKLVATMAMLETSRAMAVSLARESEALSRETIVDCCDAVTSALRGAFLMGLAALQNAQATAALREIAAAQQAIQASARYAREAFERDAHDALHATVGHEAHERVHLAEAALHSFARAWTQDRAVHAIAIEHLQHRNAELQSSLQDERERHLERESTLQCRLARAMAIVAERRARVDDERRSSPPRSVPDAAEKKMTADAAELLKIPIALRFARAHALAREHNEELPSYTTSYNRRTAQ